MKRNLLLCAGVTIAAVSLSAQAAPGEYWKVTAQMEMPGMPMAMPAQTMKVCLPKGGEADPNKTQGKDSHCTFTDVKQSGNTVRFKGTCVDERGEKMKVSGETTHTANSFKTKMQMTGGDGESMTMNSSGKRVGGACDSEEVARKAQAQAAEGQRLAAQQQRQVAAEACDTSKADGLIGRSGFYSGAQPMCTNKKQYCAAVRKMAERDVQGYESLADQEERVRQSREVELTSIVRLCKLDMGGVRKAVCKNSLHSGPQEFMDKNCTAAQAKAYREYARKQQCGRDYTSPDAVKDCEAGKQPGATGHVESGADKAKAGAVDEGVKKLKSFLPF